jgi:uncharacterized protein YtpQ (UPF0354 family)
MNDFLSRAVAYLKAAHTMPGNGAGTTDPNDPVLTRLTEGVVIAYVVDEPQGLVFVQRRHLQEANMSVEQLHRQAVTNLSKLRDSSMRVQKHGPIYGVFLDGNFEASLFLLERLWQRDLAPLVDKGYAVCIPARDIMAFCDMDSQEGMATLRGMIEQVFDGGDHLLTQTIFRMVKKDTQ